MKIVPLVWILTSVVIVTSPFSSGQQGELRSATDIAQIGLFEQAILWSGEVAPSDNEATALWDAIGVGKVSSKAEAVENIEHFLTENPDSPFSASLHSHVALYYRKIGRSSSALAHWARAWEKSSTATDQNGRQIADFTLAHWTKLLSSLGRADALRDIFASTRNRDLADGPLTQMFLSSREAFEAMLRHPDNAYRCGTLALANISQSMGLAQSITHKVKQIPSPQGGFSLGELVNISSTSNIPVVAVRSTNEEIPVPSVVHWKEDHYAAIIEVKGNRYLVVDPTFGSEKWIGKDVLIAEASGFFLVPTDNVPLGWREATPQELATIKGKGVPNRVDDSKDEPCSEPPTEECPGNCPPGLNDSGNSNPNWNCPACDKANVLTQTLRKIRVGGSRQKAAGMPFWEVSEPFISLWIHDKPLWYTPPVGPEVAFELSYKQRDVDLIPSYVYTLGPGWRHNWLTWVDEDGPELGWVHAASGAVRDYWLTGAQDYRTQASLQQFTSEGGAVTHYELTFPDGSKDVYGFLAANLTTGEPEHFFITERIDSVGQKLTFSYFPFGTNAYKTVMLEKITDAEGRVTTIQYDSVYTNQIARVVVQSLGYTNTLTYASGKLSSISDVGTLVTSFLYDSNGWITNMNTPYGDTRFVPTGLDSDFTDGDEYNIINRSIEIATPNGARHLYMYRDSSEFLTPEEVTPLLPYGLTDPSHMPSISPLGQDLDTNYFAYRNSFYWGPLQYSHLSTTNVDAFTVQDYTKARLRHWLHNAIGVGDTLSIERNPAPDIEGNLWGATTWYDYAGKDGAFNEGSSILPNAIMRVMPDGNTWFQKMDRDEWGHVTNMTERYSTPTGFSIRTNQFIFESQRMVAHFGPSGLVVSNRYDSSGNMTHQFQSDLLQLTEYFYNIKQQLTGIRYASGLVRTNLYFTSGAYSNWLERTIQVGFSTNAFTYTNGLIHTERDFARGITVTNTWDNLQRLTKKEVPGLGATTYIYQRLDLAQIITSLGTNSFGYDGDRHRISHTNELKHVTRYEYCPCGSLESETDALQNSTVYKYNNQGLTTNIVFADGYSVTLYFDSLGRLTNSVDSFGSTSAHFVNMQGLTAATWDGPNLVLTNRYDHDDLLTNSVDANGVVVNMTYDALDRLLTRAHPGVSTNQFGYTARGMTNSVDGLGKATFYGFDAMGRKTSETNANGEITRFSYNGLGDLLTLTDGRNHVTTWNYDEHGRVTNKVQHGGTEVLRYGYDALGRLTSRWSIGKLETIYRYNWDGTLTNIDYTTSPDIVLGYDAVGRLLNMVDAAGTSAYTYDDSGQVLSEDGPWANDTVTISYNQRLRGSLSVAQPYGSARQQSYGYDSARRLTNITSGDRVFSYLLGGSSAASLLPKRILFPNGAYITNTYDSVARLKGTFLKNSANNPLNSHQYLVNAAHQRYKQTFTADNYVDYTYDNIGQLTSALGKEEGGGVSRAHEQLRYDYDAAGNLEKRTNNLLVQTFTVNALNQLSNLAVAGSTITVAGYVTTNAAVTVNGGGATVYEDLTFSRNVSFTPGENSYTAVASDSAGRTDSHSVTTVLPSTVPFQYDQNGNLTSDGVRTFEYDDENQLIAVTLPNVQRSEFVYDGKMRRRISREYVPGGRTAFVSSVTTGTLRSNFPGWVGFKFTVGSSPITVSELGRWIVSGNSQPHTVKLVTTAGTDVPGASVIVQTQGATAGQFRYVSLSAPVTLLANTAYYLVTEEFDLGDQWYHADSVLGTTSVGTINCAVYANAGTSTYNLFGSPNQSYGPPSLRYQSGNWILASEKRYVYDGLLVVQERDHNNVPTVTYTRGPDLSGTLQGAGGIGGLLGRTDHSTLASTQAYYHADGNGNVTMLINEQQVAVAEYTYEPFGNTLAMAGPLAEANTYRFSSKEIHPGSELYYYGYRFYEPNLQRWLNRDPIQEWGGLNLYASFGNNPYFASDPFGLSLWDYIPVIGTAISCFSSAEGERPADYTGKIDCEECKFDKDLAETTCKQKIDQQLRHDLIQATKTGIGRFGVDAIITGIGTITGLPGWIVGTISGIDGAVGLGCTAKSLFNMRRSANTAKEKLCKCPEE